MAMYDVVIFLVFHHVILNSWFNMNIIREEMIQNDHVCQIGNNESDSSLPHVLKNETKSLTAFNNFSNQTNIPKTSYLLNDVHEVIVQHVVKLNFKPPCQLFTREAIDVINRVTSMDCKKEIANIACLDMSGQLYPERLPRYCPAQGPGTGDYLGCYKDSRTMRILGGHVFRSSDNTPHSCVDRCMQLGFYLSGVQYGRECFCGYETPNSTFILPESECNMTCSGDQEQSCGGFLTTNVYYTGISKHVVPQQNKSSIDLNGPRAKVLYLLTVGGRSVRQVRRLFKALYHATETYFFIHVDLRQDYMYRELLPLEKKFANVRLSRWRRSTIWGGYTLLDVILHCMQEVLSMPDWKWDSIINLSESDFPIKIHDKLINFLTVNNRTNFINFHHSNIKKFLDIQGIQKTFHECENRMWNVGDRRLPLGIQIEGGSDWFVLSRDFVTYAVHDTSELVLGLKSVFMHTLLPVESFFQTLLLNSEFCRTASGYNLRFINWKRHPVCGCFHRDIVDWCGCSPSALKSGDWKAIRDTNSINVFFARKFQSIINQAIIDQVETWLYGSSSQSLPGSASYWENEFHVEDASPIVDSAFYTVYQSLSRLSLKLLASLLSKEDDVLVGRILEATLYNENDIFKGTLVIFEAIGRDNLDSMVLETYVKARHHFDVFNSIAPTNRIKSMQVGTHYNEKDKLFYNLGAIIGPHSNVGLLHDWIAGEPLNATFVWIDPAFTVANWFQVAVPTEDHKNLLEPKFDRPLKPGVWIVKLMNNWETVAETKFLVVPLSHNGTSIINPDDAILVNGGSSEKVAYASGSFSNIYKILGISDEMHKQNNSLTEKNGKLLGRELLSWIDTLVEAFYDIQDTCHVTMLSSNSSSYYSSIINPCQFTSWSSRSPDPKSVIGDVNKFTRRIQK